MKKIIVGIVLALIIVFLSNSSDMIRIRVLANSNSEYDQKIKGEVVNIVKEEFKKILKDTKNIDEAREKINENLEHISNEIDSFLTFNQVEYGSKVNFGLNYFPSKEYNKKTYNEGYYESVLVTLGTGNGDNWWCILFPTVCLNDENVKYESILKNIFEKILK